MKNISRKQVINFINYSVDCEGNVFNLKGHNLKGEFRNNYSSVRLYKRGVPKGKLFNVHRLVAAAFIPNPENKPQVNHKNGIKTDNRVENLEWVTVSENHRHKHDVLKKSIGSNHKGSKLNEKQVKKIRDFYSNGKTQVWISKKYNISQSNISDIIKRKIWVHI